MSADAERKVDEILAHAAFEARMGTPVDMILDGLRAKFVETLDEAAGFEDACTERDRLQDEVDEAKGEIEDLEDERDEAKRLADVLKDDLAAKERARQVLEDRLAVPA